MNLTKNFRWIADDDRICRHIFRDHAARADDRVFADCDVGQNRNSGSDGGALLHDGPLDLPVGLGLQLTVGGGTRVSVIDEHHPVPNEDVVFDGDPLAHEGVARDLASLADGRVLLNFDKGSDFCLVSNFATVEVDELRELYIRPEFDRGCNRYEFIHKKLGYSR